jgi:hypothetical protein
MHRRLGCLIVLVMQSWSLIANMVVQYEIEERPKNIDLVTGKMCLNASGIPPKCILLQNDKS